MKKIFFLALLISFTGCNNDNESSKSNGEESLAVNELQSLSNIEEGSKGRCLALNFDALKCAPNKEDLTSQQTSETYDILVPVTLNQNIEANSYILTQTSSKDINLPELTERLQTSEDSYDYVLYKHVTSDSLDYFTFLNFLSNEEGINSSGTIEKFSMDVNGVGIPVSYAVDCSDDSTTFHTVIGNYGVKMTYSQEDLGNNIFKLTSVGVRKDNKKAVTTTAYCTPTNASNSVGDVVEEGAEDAADAVEEGVEDAAEAVEEGAEDLARDIEETASAVDDATDEAQDEAQEAVVAIDNALEETGEAVQQAAEDAGESIEQGIENTVDAAQELGSEIESGAEDAADAATETLADGLEATDKALEEGAAIIEGTAEAIAEEVVETANAAADNISENIDEARAENSEEEDEEGGFINWLRNLFR